jgi:alpha-N-arabinofuranosidase
VPVIDASASLDGNDLVLNVVNRHQSQAIEVAIALEDRSFSGTALVAEVNGPDIKAENDFGKTLVATRTSSVNAAGSGLTYSFPPHSYTQLKARLG